jgi:amino acid permease
MLPDAKVGGANFQLGGKTIGVFGSFCLMVNNVSGPGMLALPIVFQQAGWLFSSLMLIFMCIMSSLAGTFLCDTIARVPGNSDFGKRVEFETVFTVFMGKGYGVLAQILFVICLMAQCLASIVQAAQVFDCLVVYVHDRTKALEVYPSFSFIEWRLDDCDLKTNPYCVPFQDEPERFRLVLTAGYVLLSAVVLPMGCMNLDENMKVQILSFLLLCALTVIFAVHYLLLIGLHSEQGIMTPSHREEVRASSVPMIGEEISEALGTIFFNFAWIVFLPSW